MDMNFAAAAAFATFQNLQDDSSLFATNLLIRSYSKGEDNKDGDDKDSVRLRRDNCVNDQKTVYERTKGWAEEAYNFVHNHHRLQKFENHTGHVMSEFDELYSFRAHQHSMLLDPRLEHTDAERNVSSLDIESSQILWCSLFYFES